LTLALTLAVILAVLPLCGCWAPDWKLIDQRTFWPANTPGTAEVARANVPKLPLAVIRFEDLDADYRPALAEAVQAAEDRKADVEFDVLAPIPTTAPPEEQERYTSQGQADAQEVATALAADGVLPDRVHIGFLGDPGSPPREVRVYVR
jgi:hypothetical protein